jgi:zinc protease
MRRHPGPFIVSTAVQTEVTSRAVSEILRETAGIREEPVTGREIEDARNLVAGIFPLRLQTTDGVASRLAEIAMHSLPLDYFDSYRERILAVTPEEVLAAARTRIRPAELAVVLAGDAASIRESIEQLDIAPIEILSPEELD